MPLSVTTLRGALRAIMDPGYVNFAGYPTSPADAGVRWGQAFRDYFDDIAVPPGITGGNQGAAQAAFTALFVPTPALGNGAALLSDAAAAYAALMISGAGVTVPPPLPLVVTLTNNTDGQASAIALAVSIDTWARTGTFTPPSAPTVPWS